MGFERWVVEELQNLNTYKRWGTKPFTTPQYQWISPGVDFIGRFEHLEEDFQTVCDKLNISATLQFQTRTRTTHEPYREVYTDKMINKVAKVFAEDIEYFKHEF